MACTTRTAVLHGVRDIRIESRSCPPPKPGQVQVAVQSVGLCGSDLAYWAHGVAGGVFPIDFPGSTTTGYKGQMGHEVAGTVVALGDGVTSLKLGDHVALEAGVPCRECVYCKIGRYNLCPKIKFIGSFVNAVPGALTERFNHDASSCYKLPPGISHDEGALLEPLSVALSAVSRGGVAMGDRVLVTGAGTVGLLVLMAARAAGAASVVVTDVVQRKLEQALQFGATAAVSAKDDVLDSVGGTQFDVAIECCGVEAALATCVGATKPGGRVVVVANQHGSTTKFPLQQLARREIDLIGIYRYCNSYSKALRLLECGKIAPKGLVSHTFPLDQVGKAFETLASGAATKVIVNPSLGSSMRSRL